MLRSSFWCVLGVVSLAGLLPAQDTPPAEPVPAAESEPEKKPDSPAAEQAEGDEPLELKKKDKPAAAKAADQTPDKKPEATGPEADPKDLPAKPTDDTDDLKGLDPNASDRDPLEDAIREMRQAQQLIEGEKPGPETRKLQDQIVKNLDELIKELQNPPSSSSSSSSSSSNSKQQQQQKKSASQRLREMAMKQKQKQQQGQAQAQPKPMPQKPQQGEAQDKQDAESSESQEKRKQAEAEEARRRQLAQDVWGHLPPHWRAQLQNVYNEKYLPKYSELVQRYYEALAERNQAERAPRK